MEILYISLLGLCGVLLCAYKIYLIEQKKKRLSKVTYLLQQLLNCFRQYGTTVITEGDTDSVLGEIGVLFGQIQDASVD